MVLYFRASSKSQILAGTLERSRVWARRKCRELGFEIIAEFKEQAHSSIFNPQRLALRKAIKVARQRSAILLMGVLTDSTPLIPSD